MKSLIIGYGEVGEALYKVLSPCYETRVKDINTGPEPDWKPEILHICFPYSDNFINDVKEYQKEYRPGYTIIHSTVPVGTSAKLGASHSPIRGMHPRLEGGIKTFPKFIGGERNSEVADYFRRVDLRVVLFDKAETTEAMKLWDTEYYKICIEFAQRVKRYCDKHNLNFHEVYTLSNQTYGESYVKLGHPEFVRPVLQPILTPIGGHCVIPNSKMLDE